MNSKISLYGIILLLLIIAGQFFYFKYKKNLLLEENILLKKEKKEKLIKIRDSAFVKIKNITELSQKKFDSILNIPPTIKWKKYEKPVYIYRTLDDALDIHSRYKSDTKSAKKNK